MKIFQRNRGEAPRGETPLSETIQGEIPQSGTIQGGTPQTLCGGKEILSMRGIVKQYQMGDEISTVLKGIDLSVREGEFLAVLGPSGSGKSTLMNIIGCLDTPTEGEYYLSGRHIANQDEKALAHIRSKEIGFIFQSFYLLQRQNALENVELQLIYANIP